MLRLIVMVIATLTTLPTAAAQTRPASFVDVSTVVPNLVVDMRYLGSDNFVGKPIDGYEKPICYLTREAAAALAEVARDLEPQGLAIKAFDCYRPVRAVAHFVRWAQRPARSGAQGASTIRRSTSATCSATAISPRAPAIRAARRST